MVLLNQRTMNKSGKGVNPARAFPAALLRGLASTNKINTGSMIPRSRAPRSFNMGQGLGKGGGRGDGMGSGRGEGLGGGQGRNKGGAYGTGGFCVCAKCGEKVPHQQGVKCTTLKCPKCGHTMIREELLRDKNL